MQTFAGLMKSKQGKTEVAQQAHAEGQNNTYAEVDQNGHEQSARRNNSITKPFRRFHNWCNSIIWV